MKAFTIAAVLFITQALGIFALVVGSMLPATYFISGEVDRTILALGSQLGLILGAIVTVAEMGIILLSPSISAMFLTEKMTHRLVRWGVLDREFLHEQRSNYITF